MQGKNTNVAQLSDKKIMQKQAFEIKPVIYETREPEHDQIMDVKMYFTSQLTKDP